MPLSAETIYGLNRHLATRTKGYKRKPRMMTAAPDGPSAAKATVSNKAVAWRCSDSYANTLRTGAPADIFVGCGRPAATGAQCFRPARN